MRKRKSQIRKLLGMLLLVGFLLNQCFSFFVSQKSADDRAVNIYSYYAGNSTTPATEAASTLKISFQLFFVAFIFLLFQGFKSKTRKPLITSNYERNYFYQHVTIHAP
jgi:hypothetical protein